MNKERLQLLANHLRKPREERLHPIFDFDAVRRGERSTVTINWKEDTIEIQNCGTAGCAMGEAPFYGQN